MTVDPRYIPTFKDWADYSYPDLEVYGAIATVIDDSDWQNWGAGLLSLNGIASAGVPNPYQFDDWKEWAMRLNQIIDQGT
jgi:hypothetical protein